MLSEEQIAAVLLAHPRLRDAGEALIAAANDAGGRDNITVVLLRLEEVQVAGQQPPVHEGATMVALPAVSPAPPASDGAGHDRAAAAGGATLASGRRAGAHQRRTPRVASTPPARARQGRRLRLRRAGALAIVLAVLVMLGSAAYLALQSVYFIGTNSRGLVTLYQGLPYSCPATSRCTAAATSPASAPPRSVSKTAHAARSLAALRSRCRLADPQPRTGAARMRRAL